MQLHRSMSVLCLVSLLFLPLMQACHSDFPDDVLKPSKMEDVLYDYHIAQALAQQSASDSIDYNIRLYQKAVFEKYGINEAVFDHSMQWYERHSTQLKKIYEHIAERLGGNANEGAVNFAGLNSVSGDTLSIWSGPSSALLCSQNVNRFCFTLRADTALQKGDMLYWKFSSHWFYREGEHRAVASIAIHYEGDSISTMQQFVYSDGEQYISTQIGNRKVLSIDCFIYQCAPWVDRVRILSIQNMQMFRVRQHEVPEVKEDALSDSIKREEKASLNAHQRLRDSLLKLDTLNERKPHFI